MTTNHNLDEILAELGREHREIGAPESLGLQLSASAGSRIHAATRPRTQFRWAATAAALLLAALATIGGLWRMRRNQPTPSQQSRSAPAPQPGLIPEASFRSAAAKQPPRLPSKPRLEAVSARRYATPRDSTPEPSIRNSLDEFIPLPASEGLPTAAELSVVRIRLRGSDLQQYGLQAPPDAFAQTMLADFVVGEDGLPRAIRILR